MATDFSFVDKAGAEHSISECRSEYVLLLFASADCEDCKRMKRDIDANTRLWMMLRRGTLAVVAITITDDESLWQATTSPANWIEGWDRSQSIENEGLYDLTTKPRLYLLDNEHKILLKTLHLLKSITTLQPCSRSLILPIHCYYQHGFRSPVAYPAMH